MKKSAAAKTGSIDQEETQKLTERLNLATHAAQMGIWDWDIQKNELVWDDQMYRLYGLKPNDFGGAYEAWLNGVHPDDRAASNEVSQQAVRGEKEYDTEFRVVWPDGSIHWLKANGQVFRDEEGKPIRMVGVNYDITARKQTETKLSESEQKFSSLFNKSVYATTLSRLPDGVIVDVNEAFEQEFGFTRQEAIGKTSFELGFNPDAEGRARMLAEIKEHGSARNHELPLRTKSNEMRMFSVNIDLVDIDGQKYILNTTKDITEQKQAEQERDKLIERLDLATHAAQMGIWDWDIQKNELVWDDQMYRLYGLKPNDFGGAYEAWLNGVHPDDRVSSNASSQQAVHGEKEYDTEFRVLWPDGSIHWLKANGQVFRDEEGKPIRMVGVNYDISARKQAEEKLKESDEYLRMGYEAGDLGIWKNDLQTGAVEFDERARIHYGFDTLHTTIAEVMNRVHPDDLARLGSEINSVTAPDGSGKFATEYRVIHADGSVHRLAIGVQVLFEGEGAQRKPVIGYGTTQDITERKQAEGQIIQMKRLYATLSQVNQTIVRVKDHNDLYQSICDVSTKFGEFALAWIGLLNEATGDVVPIAASGLDLTQWPFPQINIYQETFKNSLTSTALLTSTVVTSEDVITDERTKSYRSAMTNQGYHAAAVVPFQLRGKTIGMLSLVSYDTELFKSQEEFLLLKEMGGDISFALDTMETETERKQTEDALKESEARFSKIFFTNPVAQSILSTISGQTVEVNDACCRLYEYSHEELIGTDPGSLDLWANPAEQLEVLEELQRTGRLLPREITIRPKSGEIHTILFSVEQIAWKGEPCLITSSVDISERKHAEQKLHESEVLLRQVLESVPDSTFALDRDYRLLIDNKRHQQELIASGGHPFVIGEQMLSPDYPAEVLEFWRAAYDRTLAGETFSLEGSWVDINGQSHVHENLFSPLRDATGTIIGALVVAHDITQRKQAENAMREREQKLNAILNLLPVGVSILDQDQKVAYSNDALRKILGITNEGLTRGEYRNRKYLRTDGSEKPPEEFASARAFTEKIEINNIITGIVKEDNQTVWTSVSAVPVDFPDWKVILVTSDITERKRAEHEIQRQIQRLQGLHTIDQAISSSMDLKETINIILQQTLGLLNLDASMVLLFDEEQQTLYYAAGKGFRADAVTKSQIDLGLGLAGEVALTRKTLHVPNLPQIGEKFLRAEMLKEDQFMEYFGVPLIAKDSLKGVLEIFNRTPLNPDAEWLNFLEVLGGQTAIAIDNAQLFEELERSNTELELRVKQRTADLLRVNAELEHANRAKDAFLANMSHELRTPLTGILGLSESLQISTYGSTNDKQIRALQNIELSGRHLLALINDILDLSKIEAGKFDIYPEMINLEDVCRASLIFVKEQAQKKSILLNYQGTENAKSVFADPRRLKQIMVNLLSNAVKFTPEKGKVTLSVQTDSQKDMIQFAVTDTGIGIARVDLDRLFTPFTQVDSQLNRQYEGTGLGLALVLRLTEMHGGNIEVVSEPGHGSSFIVSLPWQSRAIAQSVEQVEKTHLPVAQAVTPNSRGVLLYAEDNQLNIEIIGDYLQFQGFTLVVAQNGMEALIKAEECNPRLILMDIQMPVMDGLEATRRLRSDSRFASTPVIALTALAMTGDREKCLEAGATDYLSKPVSLRELAEKINKLLK